MHGSECVWQRGHAWQGVSIAVILCFYRCLSVHRGACMPRGCAWCAWQEACMAGGMHGWGMYMAGETATTAGGTHPTGMHSYPSNYIYQINYF